MLVKLSMENFKSFMEKAEVDLNATGYEILEETNKTEDGILKGALFVGGNATGKSTVLQAIRFLLELLVWQINSEPRDYLCLFKEATGKPKLKYEFLINKQKISYEIEWDETGLSEEKLLVEGKERLSRIGANAKYIDANDNKITIENLQPNQSSIRKVYFDTKFIDDETLKLWFNFLEQSIYIDQANRLIYKSIGNSSIITYKDYFEKNGTDKFNKFLEEIGYDQSVEYTNKIGNGKVSFSSANGQKEIVLKRRHINLILPLSLESVGNKTLIELLPIVFDAMQNNAMVIIDEFSSGFHNELEERVIRYFMENSKNAQLFLVSHSTNLLSNTLLRPDQIYTVDFVPKKGSKLNRVSDSKPREAQNLEKMYLSGVFNGLPNIK